MRQGLREEIIRASLELGQELGEEGLTMRAIAAKLGVSATALYQHFDSKASILQAIRLYGLDRLNADMERIMDDADPVGSLHAVSVGYVDFARRNPWLYTVLFDSEELDWSQVSPEELQRVFSVQKRISGYFAALVEQGRYRKDVDPGLAPFSIWAANHGLAMFVISGRISETHLAYPVEDLGKFIEDFVARGLRGFEA